MTIIGKARCPHCGYITSTGGIADHVKHCSKNPDSFDKRNKAYLKEVPISELPQNLREAMSKTAEDTKNLKNRKHTPQAVLNLLWAIRNHDKFYFDTYGKLWLSEMIKESIKINKK